MNHSKFIIVSYRDQEKFNVTFMRYKKSLLYMQRQTDAMLRSYQKFTCTYINDIIIFSLILKNHLQHLQNVFDLFHAWCVNLTSNKSFLDYSSIILLNQWVDSLRIFTFKNKIKIIISLQFSNNLRNLKTFSDFIEWLCFLISWYAQRAWFLQKRKTILFKEVLRAYQDWLKLVNDLVEIWSRYDSTLFSFINTLFFHQHLVQLHHLLFMLQTHFFQV